MIISVDEAKTLVNLEGWTDQKIEMKLKSIEQIIRKYTNNNFQKRAYRKTAAISGGLFSAIAPIPFEVGDTVQISNSELNEGLYTVETVNDDTFTVKEAVKDEFGVLVTKVEYPADVIDCVINLLEWEKKGRKKVGIKSETLSRHSVTYEDSASMFMGYPKGILGSLSLNMKARF